MSIDLPNPLSPTVDQVASLIRSRTKDSNGNEVGTFTEDTRPTATQAQEAIDNQVTLLHAKVGTVGEDCSGLAQLVAAYGAAAEIEASYFAEQARRDMSPYIYLIQRYEEYVQGLVDCVQGNLPDAPDPLDPDAQSVRFGTLDAISGTVHDFYTGRHWPALPNYPQLPPDTDTPDPPDP